MPDRSKRVFRERHCACAACAAPICRSIRLKAKGPSSIDALAQLVDRGTLVAVKYAIVRDDPLRDDYFGRLLQNVPPAKVISGMGERPVLLHARQFGLRAWTTGSGRSAPHTVTDLLRAAKTAKTKGTEVQAQRLYDAFAPLETLRDETSSVRVLRDAVTCSKLADMRPILPLPRSTPIRTSCEDRSCDAGFARHRAPSRGIVRLFMTSHSH